MLFISNSSLLIFDYIFPGLIDTEEKNGKQRMKQMQRKRATEREKAYEGASKEEGKFYDKKDKTRNAVDNSTDGEHARKKPSQIHIKSSKKLVFFANLRLTTSGYMAVSCECIYANDNPILLPLLHWYVMAAIFMLVTCIFQFNAI